jgi:hypothetical protein
LRSDDGATSVIVDHPARSLGRRPGGGFAIEAEGLPAVRASATRDGWRIEEPPDLRGWSLRRTEGEAPGFVLLRAGQREAEVGRTMPLVGTGREAGLRFLLLEDGRLFRIVLAGPRRGGFDLLGWETPGAYLTARPRGEAWEIAATVAGRGIPDLTTLSILFAAEILEADAPPHHETR